jgi:primase-polymerase (primpol)-like protein
MTNIIAASGEIANGSNVFGTPSAAGGEHEVTLGNAFYLNAVPTELRECPQWIAWWLVQGEGKPVKLPNGTYTNLEARPKAQKLPINPHSGGLAATNRPATWGTFKQAVAAAERYGVTGPGFVFAADDPYVGVDLDNCRNPESGEIHPAAAEIIKELNSYTEISPSGTGVKIFVRASGMPGNKHRIQYSGGEIEIYSKLRYFTVTSLRLPDCPTTIEDRNAELQQVYAQVFGSGLPIDNDDGDQRGDAGHDDLPRLGTAPVSTAPDGLLLNLSDAEIVAKACAAKNGAKFRALYYSGDTSEYCGNHSAADIALCNLLAFWFRDDPARIDAAFRQSALMRDKWDEKHSADGSTYGQMTIRRALAQVHAIYDPLNGGANTSPGTPEREKPGAAAQTDEGSPETGKPTKANSQASTLIRLAAPFEYFHSGAHQAYVTFNVNGHRETHVVRSRAFKLQLQALFFNTQKTAINSKALADALGVLEARALFEGPEHPVFTRVGEMDGKVYVDIGSDDWSALEIDRDSWRINMAPPIRSIRPHGMHALPTPVRQDGALDTYLQLLNLGDAEAQMLFVGWMLSALRPQGPYPLLSLRSSHGGGKTTISRAARAIIDPNQVPMRTLPREEQEVFLAATHSWVLAFDNVSKISDALSDALCRLSTGGGFGTRELYTNDEEFLFSAQRPVIINGIDDSIRRTDLLDRTIQIDLPQISEENRLPESDLNKRLAEVAPGVLAHLLDGVVEALRNIDSIDLARLPRMADFAMWVEAAAPAFGWKPGEFLKVYVGNRAETTAATLSSSVVGKLILNSKNWKQEVWEGTATELLKELEGRATERERNRAEWPRSARAMSNVLRHLAPSLREVGVEVIFIRDSGRGRERIIQLKGIDPAQTRLFGPVEVAYPE